MSLQQLVDFDNVTVIPQPSNLAALFFKDKAAVDDATKQTFESMGLRSEKAVAFHLLLENAYESNLVADIAKVDYLAENLGRTNLRPLAGLPPFVDDIYVFGYLSREECVFRNGRLSCTSRKDGCAKLVVASIANALERALAKWRANTAIVHTVGEGKAESSTIRATIAKIEKNTFCKAKSSWFGLHPGKEIAGYFVAKCDVSEVPLEELHRALPVFERTLVGGSGYGIYSIDYTQDFSGVLDRKALVGFLGFETAENFCTAIGGDGPRILENTDSVGEHVCTWMETAPEGHATRTKIYNKVVSIFEAGEIREPVGGHLAEYADCPNRRLRQTFFHPDVQARGCTRIEVSLYGCPLGELSDSKASTCIEKVLERVSVKEDDGLFVVQPPSKQWQNLAANLDRCLVLADRPQGHIFVAWGGHTKTGRIFGVHVPPTPTNVEDPARWEKAVQWAAADFGFRSCPIFRVDILAADDKGVELGPLRCFWKDENARTVLAASKKPTQLHPNGGPLPVLLPATDKIEWEWRTKKCSAIGREPPRYELQEVSEIAQWRRISAFSTRNRASILAEPRYASTVEEWKRAHWQKEEEARKAREAEIAALRMYAEAKRKSGAIRADVLRTLERDTQKLSALDTDKKWKVLGFREKEDKYRVVLQEAGQEEPVSVWATKGLRKILLECAPGFHEEEDKFGRKLSWLVAYDLELRIAPAKTLRNNEGTKITWNQIQVLKAPDPGRLAILQAIGAKCEEYGAELAKTAFRKVLAPANKDTKRTTDLPAGEYIAHRYAAATFRKSPLTILFLLPLGEDGKQKTDEETPTHGFFLEKEVAALGGQEALGKRKTPLHCRLGRRKRSQTRENVAALPWRRPHKQQPIRPEQNSPSHPDDRVWQSSSQAAKAPPTLPSGFVATTERAEPKLARLKIQRKDHQSPQLTRLTHG